MDAKNWMAHPGSANVILNIFRHRNTPQHFVILSGDVHYSFAYDVKIRFRENTPDIWQITCSGLKNEFPHRLLCWFDRLNRWLYSSRSPLNWFTKRRRMRVSAFQPEGLKPYRLANRSGVGQVSLSKEGVPVEICLLPVLADRGFGDHKLLEFLLNELGFSYVIRIRRNITVTSANGEQRTASDWVGKNGRLRTLRDAMITGDLYPVSTVVCVHDKGMKEPWCIVASDQEDTGREIVKYYAKR